MPHLLYAFPKPLVRGLFIRRYKRFFVDVCLQDGSVVTAHTPNTGSMMGLLEEGREVLMSYLPSPTRKLAYTLQAIKCNATWVGVNTHAPNAAVASAFEQQLLPAFAGYDVMAREVPYGEAARSRIDLLLKDSTGHLPDAYIEVKNVTLRLGEEACFPDAVTERGLKHLHELMAIKKQGRRAVMIFFVHRNDCLNFRPAHEIDPAYARGFEEAKALGVEMQILKVHVNDEGIWF